jgi:pimeloyl-ACP methyl ester carboxylesterase
MALFLIGCSSSGSDEEATDPAGAPAAAVDRAEMEPGDTVTIDVTANDADPGGQKLIVRGIADPPGNGTATISDSGLVDYSPDEGFTGVDTFSYEVADSDGDAAVGEVEIDVGDTTGAEETAIAWGTCSFEHEEPTTRAAFEELFSSSRCATVDVPIDYSDPARGTMELYASYRPALADDSLGPLFVNQGGPGMEAAQYPLALTPNPALNRFDVVGMDPRGTGRSTHLDCGTSTLDWGDAVIPGPDDPLTDFEQAAVTHAEACAVDPNLAYFGTNNAARDMDRLRDLLGAEQITYHGKSYGSDLGTAYASLFPQRLRAALFDGATDLRLDLVDFTIQQARAGEQLWERYLQHCRANTCNWAEGADPAMAWSDLVSRLRVEPLVDPQTGVVLTAGELREYAGDLSGIPFEDVDEALDQLVIEGTTEDIASGPTPDWVAEVLIATVAITCLDMPADNYRDGADRLSAALDEPLPGQLQTLAACATWPARDPIAINDAAGSGPILVTATTGDVPTPHESSVGLAEALAEAGLVEWDADVHTAYSFSRCVADHADTLLVDLELPVPGTRCDDPVAIWIGVPPPEELDLSDG